MMHLFAPQVLIVNIRRHFERQSKWYHRAHFVTYSVLYKEKAK
jgi:hypothetical protein